VVKGNRWSARGAVSTAGLLAISAIVAWSSVGAAAAPTRPRIGSGTSLSVQLQWAKLLGPGSAIVESSPTEATLDGSGPSVVVGSRMDGCVYALQLATGATTPGWGDVCPGNGIDATPAALPVAGGLDDVVVSDGEVPGMDPPAANAGTGGIDEISPDGAVVWSRTLPDVFGAYGQSPPVVASPAIGDTSSGQSIVVGDVGLSLYSLDPATGQTEPGWPQQSADTTFATAAIANVDGTQSIIAASDSTAGAGALDDWDGGSVRAMTGGGTTEWTDASNEVVTSGPVVGDLDGSGPVAVFGHGDHFGGSDNDAVTAVDAATGGALWKAHLDGYTLAAPALADLDGNGQLDVVEPTWRQIDQPTGGVVSALDSQGSPLWTFAPTYSTTITGSVATGDFGEGYQDVVAATGTGWYIIDGETGQAAAPVQGVALQGFAGDPDVGNLDMENTPLVTPDPSGSGLDVVVAGTYFAGGGDDTQGFVAEYRVTDGSAQPTTVGAGAWPSYKGNAQLTGTTIAPAQPAGSCAAGAAGCESEGYLLAGADGGLFAYGNAAYDGSIPADGVHVDDIVGVAPTPDDRGYWMAGADGGVFAFGDAAFHGSMGGRRLGAPIVAMAADPATGGYWLVASDGGVFAFDAPFYGSMGGQHLASPVVGMAAASDGGGFWLVASDGGVFAFGDAAFHGSMGGESLAAPVVGMAADPSSGGYWLVASDGGMFSFDAPFYGSMGGSRLNAPVVAMAPTTGAGGYWLVAADGGVFNFGDAAFRGSAGGLALSKPVVGMVATG